MTVTLAELYLKQGLAGRAREILRKLAEGGDQAARDRLAQLGPPAAASARTSWPSAAASTARSPPP